MASVTKVFAPRHRQETPYRGLLPFWYPVITDQFLLATL